MNNKKALKLLITFCVIMMSVFVTNWFIDSTYAEISDSESVYNGQNNGQESNLIGDVNGDDNINSIDFAYMRKYLLDSKQSFPISNGLWAADTDGNGTFNSIDFAYMRKFLLGIITGFPTENCVVGPNCFEYALFSGDKERDLYLIGNRVEIFGDVRSNSGIIIGLSSVYSSINGDVSVTGDFISFDNKFDYTMKKVEDNIVFPNLRDYFLDRSLYFSTKCSPLTGKMYFEEFVDTNGKVNGSENINCVYNDNGIDQNWEIYGENLVLNSEKPIFIDGNAYISVDKISGDGIIVATGNINFVTECSLEKSEVAIYSTDGNIDCNFLSDVKYNGLLYAPNGEIRIISDDYEFYGSIVGKRINLVGDRRIEYCSTRVHEYFVN